MRARILRLLGVTAAMIGPCMAGMASAQQVTASSQDVAFAGHYYLSGVMETGSELLLRPDGTFEWYLSYGALDQFADGTWRRDGDTILLTARRPAKDKPLFGYLTTDPWSAEAEAGRLGAQYDDKVDAVRVRCPFLESDDASGPTVDPVPGAGRGAEAREAASQALAQAVAARTAVETLARSAMAKVTIDDATAADIESTMAKWNDARDRALSEAAIAGLPRPDLHAPALPKACDLPPRPATPDAPRDWQGGIAVSVVDPASGRFAHDIHITLRLADGGEAAVNTTGGRGLDLLDGSMAAAVVGATLQADFAPGRDASFTFAPVTRGILRFSIDASSLDAAPFATMVLHIDGDALVPAEFGRGRYERGK
ncbi:hypothetical protein WBP06_23755 [Novosphingobium sp. BL-8H]|uniref:hypothetical protein n=1 Tax=Novosphingobium sp. BL-8H TaxID=3127640 RepID=UPI003756D326